MKTRFHVALSLVTCCILGVSCGRHEEVASYRTALTTENRFGALTNTGDLYVGSSSGTSYWSWHYLADGIRDFRLQGNRVFVLDKYNVLSVKEGPLWAAWDVLSDNVQRFEVTSNRVAIHTTSNDLVIKEGPLHAAWITVHDNIKSFHITPSRLRIGVVRTDDVLVAKELYLGASWNVISDDVRDFQISGLRIAVLNSRGELSAKEGALSAPWHDVGSNLKKFQFSDYSDRIGLLDISNKLTIKAGALSGLWDATSKTNIADYRIDECGKLGYRTLSGLLVYDGTILSGDVSSFYTWCGFVAAMDARGFLLFPGKISWYTVLDKVVTYVQAQQATY